MTPSVMTNYPGHLMVWHSFSKMLSYSRSKLDTTEATPLVKCICPQLILFLKEDYKDLFFFKEMLGEPLCFLWLPFNLLCNSALDVIFALSLFYCWILKTKINYQRQVMHAVLKRLFWVILWLAEIACCSPFDLRFSPWKVHHWSSVSLFVNRD